jgi:hypothetical protein
MRASTYPLRIVLLASLALALTGCPTIRMPQLANPGPAGYQRYNALQYDPYPLDDVAPPVAGGRPREYDRPIPEVKRGQAFHYPRKRPAPVLTSPFPAPALPVITAPPALPTSSSMPVSPAAPPVVGLPYQAPSQAPVTIVPTTPGVRPPY